MRAPCAGSQGGRNPWTPRGVSGWGPAAHLVGRGRSGTRATDPPSTGGADRWSVWWPEHGSGGLTGRCCATEKDHLRTWIFLYIHCNGTTLALHPTPWYPHYSISVFNSAISQTIVHDFNIALSVATHLTTCQGHFMKTVPEEERLDPKKCWNAWNRILSCLTVTLLWFLHEKQLPEVWSGYHHIW